MDTKSEVRRRLKALKHFNADQVDIQEEGELRGLVVWLEDQRLTELPPGQRRHLRDVTSSLWPKHFQAYLEALGCPTGLRGSRDLTILWLLNRAIQKVYLERKEANGRPRTAPQQKQGELPFDSTDPSFVSGVGKLAAHLGLPNHPDSRELFEACLLLISKASKPQQQGIGGKYVSVDLDSLGMAVPKACLDDKALCLALKSLRFLHLRELRALQDRVNDVIEHVQKVTANPKTDTTMGQVGR